ncbi:hypothetical protein DH09_11765 [Bacillaceae bacterium JMAK1]|nr:hypothetical protein DH09_11765 [Bacillaceae bacterium JMAK1]
MKFDRLVTTIDTHTGGNPTRTVISGAPKLYGETMSKRMIEMKENHDDFRQAIMNEPRGHSVMSGAILQEPCHPDADIGVIYIETGGYLPMCGHDTIGCCTALIEGGLIEYSEPKTTIVFDTPAGLVEVTATVENGSVHYVSFENVPSFFYKQIEVEGFQVEIAYGGNFYGIILAQDAGVSLNPHQTNPIINRAIQLRKKINANHEIVHPENSFISGLTHIEFYEGPKDPKATVRNTVVVPPGGIDRSPCGTGTSAKMATLVQKQLLHEGDTFVHESIIGSLFTGTVVRHTNVGDTPAVVNRIEGQAWVTGHHQILLNHEDPVNNGFLLIPEMEEH